MDTELFDYISDLPSDNVLEICNFVLVGDGDNNIQNVDTPHHGNSETVEATTNDNSSHYTLDFSSESNVNNNEVSFLEIGIGLETNNNNIDYNNDSYKVNKSIL